MTGRPEAPSLVLANARFRTRAAAGPGDPTARPAGERPKTRLRHQCRPSSLGPW